MWFYLAKKWSIHGCPGHLTSYASAMYMYMSSEAYLLPHVHVQGV